MDSLENGSPQGHSCKVEYPVHSKVWEVFFSQWIQEIALEADLNVLPLLEIIRDGISRLTVKWQKLLKKVIAVMSVTRSKSPYTLELGTVPELL